MHSQFLVNLGHVDSYGSRCSVHGGGDTRVRPALCQQVKREDFTACQVWRYLKVIAIVAETEQAEFHLNRTTGFDGSLASSTYTPWATVALTRSPLEVA